MRRNKLLIILISSVSVSAFIFFSLNFTFRHLTAFLSKSERVNANILLVEGWLPEYAIEKAYREFQNEGYDYIITTGPYSAHEYYMLPMDGYLIFYPESRLPSDGVSVAHKIEVSAFSELGGKNMAHFNLLVNDSLVSDFFAGKKKRKYSIWWEGDLAKIDSMLIHFDNDTAGSFGDRNLYIKELVIDEKTIIPYQNNSEYDITWLDGKRRIINKLSSDAGLARNKLVSMGVDSTCIKAITCKSSKINRTLTSALAVREWLNKSEISVTGINIISSGTHAKRTWMTYKKVLDNPVDIGIISIPDHSFRHSAKRYLTKTFRETCAYIYYWLLLLAY
jgi:hypothetical protein